MNLNKNMSPSSLVVCAFILTICACSWEGKTESAQIVERPPQNTPSHQATSNESATESMPKYLKKLQWVKNADATQDLAKALATGDLAFWVLATRAPIAPGLDQTQHAALLEQCGQKYLRGVGDTIFNSEHRDLHKQAVQYATIYNQALIQHCQIK